MKVSRVLKVMLLVAVAVTIAGCSATPTRRSFNEGFKDSYVSTKVKYKLIKDKLVEKRNINVDTWRGVVTMTGRVTSSEEKERAEQLAWQVKGVRGVDNFLKLTTGTGTEPIEEVAIKDRSGAKDSAAVKGKTKDISDVAVKKETKAANKIVATKVAKPTKEADQKAVTDKKDVIESPKVADTQVRSKVSGPVIFEEPLMSKTKSQEKYPTAKREKYDKPATSSIEGADLTSEEALSKEAAEELKKLRGEDLNE